MKKLFLLFALSFVFASCNQTEAIEPTIDDGVIVTKSKGPTSVLYTVIVNFDAGSCATFGKRINKMQQELNTIYANHGGNMALLQVDGNEWEQNMVNNQPLCYCRANTILNEYNLWAISKGIGTSSGIENCIQHIRSGPQEQQVVLHIDAFL